MMTHPEYSSEELLPLSGIQHFFFCRRQWALIHVERIWQDNILTTEGHLLHQHTDDPFDTDVRDGIITSRALPVSSYRLGLSGVCDVVEFFPSPEGVALRGRSGKYLPRPVEYKRGQAKSNPCDEAQLCAQAICLEEMFSVSIPIGYLYYGEIHRRTEILLHSELRCQVEQICAEMHQYFERGYTPMVKASKACKSCSLVDECLPVLEKQIPASRYIQAYLNNEEDL